MRIAVIAANGRLGRAFVDEALAAGHSVRAGMLGDNSFTPHPQLEVIHCDATNRQDLKNLFASQDAVVSAIGHVKGSAADVQTKATETLVAVMNELGMSRFVDITGTGVRFPGDKVPIIDFFLNLAVAVIDPDRVKDGKAHQEVLKASNLEWTTLRVLKLQNVAPKPFELRLHGPAKLYVGRNEVAKAMVQVLQDHSFIRQAPTVSYLL